MCRRCPSKFEVQVDGQTIARVDRWRSVVGKLPTSNIPELARELFVRGNLYITNRLPPKESETVKLYRNEKGEVVRTDYFNEKGELVVIEEVLDIDVQAVKDLFPRDCKP